MKKTALIMALTLLSQAHAEDIQIEMRGNIYANTCIVDSASKDLTVNLGQAVSSDFKNVGDTGTWKAFSLSVSHCPQTLMLANAFFTARPTAFIRQSLPTPVAPKGWRWSLGDPQDNILLAPQASFNVLIDQNTHTATFPLAARYYVTSMPISAGTFSSVVQVTFTYQ